MKNYSEIIINRLKKFSKKDIVISKHALIRIKQRQLKIEEIKRNITNPIRLKYAFKQSSKRIGEEKYDCYFDYSKNLCHRYILVIKEKIIVVTAIKINRKWQHKVYKKIN